MFSFCTSHHACSCCNSAVRSCALTLPVRSLIKINLRSVKSIKYLCFCFVLLISSLTKTLKFVSFLPITARTPKCRLSVLVLRHVVPIFHRLFDIQRCVTLSNTLRCRLGVVRFPLLDVSFVCSSF